MAEHDIHITQEGSNGSLFSRILAATKRIVTPADLRAELGAIPDAPDDGTLYGRKDEAWVEVPELPPEATAAEMRAGIETEVRLIAPFDLRRALMTNGFRSVPLSDGQWDLVASGGQGGISADRLWMRTNTTAGNTVIAHRVIRGAQIGEDRAALNTMKPHAVSWRIIIPGSSENTSVIRRVFIGKPGTPGAGPLSSDGYGFEIRGPGLWLVRHNGSSLTETDLSITLTGSFTIFELGLLLKGDGTAEAYYNGTSLGSFSGFPTSTIFTVNFIGEAANGTTTVNAFLEINSLKIWSV
jgi:hypothetical protein